MERVIFQVLTNTDLMILWLLGSNEDSVSIFNTRSQDRVVAFVCLLLVCLFFCHCFT